MNIIKEINDAWGWTEIIAEEIHFINPFGNIIFSSEDEKFYRICPEELYLEKIADNTFEFNELQDDEDFKEDWEVEPFVEMASQKLGELEEDQKYTLKIPAVLEGEYEEENMVIVSFSDLIASSGKLALKLKDLPEGSEVSLKD